MNKYNIVLLPALISFLIIGCAKDEPQAVSDAELIQEIIDYNNKVEVNMGDLPSTAISLMENEYLNYKSEIERIRKKMANKSEGYIKSPC